MPDNETVVSTSPTQTVETIQPTQEIPQAAVEAKQQIDSMMANYGIIKPVETPKQESITETVIEAPKPTLVPFDSFKEKFGYANPEDAIREIEELRALKAQPKYEPYKFEDKESENLFNAWVKGDKKAVLNHLAEQDRLEQFANAEVDDKTADDILKLEMQVKYKDLNLSPAEIEYKFNKQYGIPKEPVQGTIEADEDFLVRKAEWDAIVADARMTKIIDAKLAKPNIVAAKSKLIFPEITNNNAADEGYTQYQQSLRLAEQVEAEDREAYKAFTPKNIETRAKYIDEANGINLEFQYEPDEESFKKSVEMASDIELFFKSFVGQDGKPDRLKFLDMVSTYLNKEKMITEAMKQTKNATIKSKLPDNTQGGLGSHGAVIPPEPTELDKQMDMALRMWNRNNPQQQRRVS